MTNDGKTKTTSRLLALLLALFMILPSVVTERQLRAEEAKESTRATTTEPQETTSDEERSASTDTDAETDATTEPETTEESSETQQVGPWQKDYYSELPQADDALIQSLIDNNFQLSENGMSFRGRLKFAAEFRMGDPGTEGEFGMTMPILFDFPFEMSLTRDRNFEFDLKVTMAMMGQKQKMSMTAYLIDHPTDADKFQLVVVSDEGSGPTYHISEVERSEMDTYLKTTHATEAIPLDQLKQFADYRVEEEGEETTTLMLLVSPKELLSYVSDEISESESDAEADSEILASAEEARESIEELEKAMEDAVDLETLVIPFEMEIDTETSRLRRFELKAEGLKELSSFDLSDFVTTEDPTDSLGQMSFEIRKFEFAIDDLNYDVPGKIELPQSLRTEIEKSVTAGTEDEGKPAPNTSDREDGQAEAGEDDNDGSDEATSDEPVTGAAPGAILPADEAAAALSPDETDALLEQGILFDHEKKTLFDEDAVHEMVKDLRPEFHFEKPAEELVEAEGEEDEDGRIIEIIGDRILVTVENTTPYPIADLSFKGKSESTGEMVSFYFQDYALLPGEKAAYQVIEPTSASNRIASAEDFELDELSVSFWDAEDHVSRVIYNLSADKITGSSGSSTDFDVLKKTGPFDPASFVLEVGIDAATGDLIYTVKNNSDLAVVYFELLTTTEDLSSCAFYSNDVLLPGNESSTQQSQPVNPIGNLNELKPRHLRVTLNENGKEVNVFYDYGLRRFIIR